MGSRGLHSELHIMDDKCYWIGFNLVKGIGAVRMRYLLAHFDSLADAWNASSEQLREAHLSPKIAETVVKIRTSIDLERLWFQIIAQGITVLTWEDDLYPPRLKEIEQPPPVLFIRGGITFDDHFSVAIVGTRRITSYGRQITEELSSFLASQGVTVVSGLARGVDAVAHSAALKAGGRTIGVLGSGVDRIYPPEHLQMAEKMMKQGAVISDYGLGTEPESANFPPRNRIISGLSMATVVVEAGETSGALITAEFAAEQGREVFAVPGSILASQSKGTNKLLQQGAQPLICPQDLMQALNLTRAGEFRAARKAIPADAFEAQLLAVLRGEPIHVDEICNRTGLPIEKISATLTLMELKGMVHQVGGMNYVSVNEQQADYEA